MLVWSVFYVLPGNNNHLSQNKIFCYIKIQPMFATSFKVSILILCNIYPLPSCPEGFKVFSYNLNHAIWLSFEQYNCRRIATRIAARCRIWSRSRNSRQSVADDILSAPQFAMGFLSPMQSIVRYLLPVTQQDTHHDWQRNEKLHSDKDHHLWLPSHRASQSHIPSSEPFSMENPAFWMAGIVRPCRNRVLSIRIPS